MRDSCRKSPAVVFIPLFWLAAWQAPSSFVTPLLLVSLLIPLVSIRTVPLWLLSSFLFYSTLVIPGSLLLAVRVWWVGAYLVYVAYSRPRNMPSALVILPLLVACLVGYGLCIGTVSGYEWVADAGDTLVRAGATILWPCTAIVAYHWWSEAETKSGIHRDLVWVFGWCGIVAVGYGVAQHFLGLNEQTVPADILPSIAGLAQYETLGRKLFTYPTPNGFIAALLLPIGFFIFRWRGQVYRLALVLAVAGLVMALSLTRSFAVAIAILLGLMLLAQGTRRLAFLSVLALGTMIIIVEVSLEDVEALLGALRFLDTAGDSRVGIWAYTLRTAESFDWIRGRGFGSAMWQGFFVDLSFSKNIESPHNVLMELLLQFGILGLGLWMAVALLIGRAAKSALRAPDMMFVSAVAVAVMVREGVAASYIISPSILSAYFWFLLGWSVAISEPARQAAELRIRRTSRPEIRPRFA